MTKVVMHAMMKWNGAGHHRAVSRQRHGHRSNNITEKNPFGSDGIDVWRRLSLVTVATQMIRPACIDADQNYMFNLPAPQAVSKQEPTDSDRNRDRPRKENQLFPSLPMLFHNVTFLL
jgi:hypothetical protein